MPFVDVAGASRTMTLGFTPTATDIGIFSLDLAISSVTGAPVPNIVALADAPGNPIPPIIDPLTGAPMPLQVRFDGQGKLVQPASGKIVLSIAAPACDQLISVDVRKVQQLSDNGDLTVLNLEQDGFLQGRSLSCPSRSSKPKIILKPSRAIYSRKPANQANASWWALIQCKGLLRSSRACLNLPTSIWLINSRK